MPLLIKIVHQLVHKQFYHSDQCHLFKIIYFARIYLIALIHHKELLPLMIQDLNS